MSKKLQEAISKIQENCIRNQATFDKKIEFLRTSISTSKILHLKCSSATEEKYGEIREIMQAFLKEAEGRITTANNLTCASDEDINKLHLKIEELEIDKKKLETRNAELNNKIGHIVIDLSEDLKEGEKLKNIIKLYKKLTGTNFDFQAGNVKGYMVNSDRSEMEVFDLERREATDKLFDLRKKIAKSDYSDLIEFTLKNNTKNK